MSALNHPLAPRDLEVSADEVSGSVADRDPRLRVLDLFSGAAGGWSLGLHRAGGFETIAACEIDPWRRAQYLRNFPGVRMYDDVRTLTADRLRADGAFPNVIVGSPPCQDASSANAAGRGLDGERTGLFMEWLRLVDECRPDWVCAENVPGIRSRGIDRVLSGLEEIGYAYWPLVVGASDLGANHPRKRVVIVARLSHADGEGQHARAGHACEMAGRTRDVWNAADADQEGLAQRQGISRDDGSQLSPALGDGTRPRHHWAASAPDFGRVDDGLSDKVARACISAYGDGIIPQLTELIGNAILSVHRMPADSCQGFATGLSAIGPLPGTEGGLVADQEVKILLALHGHEHAVEIEPCRCPIRSTK